MHNKVVFKVAQTLQTLGMPTLRFNFRGVGHSTGTYDEGRGEMDDARYALEFLSRRYPGLPVIMAGFSFGAYIALRVAAVDDRVQAMIGLGVPARMFEEDYLQGSHKPKLIIHGTNDELAPYDLAVQWFEQVPAPKSMVAVQDADHFFYLQQTFETASKRSRRVSVAEANRRRSRGQVKAPLPKRETQEEVDGRLGFHGFQGFQPRRCLWHRNPWNP